MKRLSLLLAGIMMTVSLVGCGNSSATESATAGADNANVAGDEAASQSTEPVEVRAWHDNDEAMMNALALVKS